jgi:hypothetical protein
MTITIRTWDRVPRVRVIRVRVRVIQVRVMGIGYFAMPSTAHAACVNHPPWALITRQLKLKAPHSAKKDR